MPSIPARDRGALWAGATSSNRAYQWLGKARTGERHLVLLSGEAGAGKTALLDAFAAGLASGALVCRGQCLEQHGGGEPYLPVMEILGQVCEQDTLALALLTRTAPTWLVQMPGLLDAAQLESLQKRLVGATQARMLREMAEALEAISTTQDVILVFEDLHWSDRSTLELLDYVLRRRSTARLLIVASYRPEELASRLPLNEVLGTLLAQPNCHEVRLPALTYQDVRDYVQKRFAQQGMADLARLVAERSEGNALFMVSLVEHFIAQGTVCQREGRWEIVGDATRNKVGLPHDLQHLLRQRLERLAPRQRCALEAASVCGMEFSGAEVGAALDDEAKNLDATFEALALSGHFVRESDIASCPNGPLSGSYRFIHQLYQYACYQRIGHGRRARLHRRVGQQRAERYAGQHKIVAAELAQHFELGGDQERGLHFRALAARAAAARSAHHEAIVHAYAALELLQANPRLTCGPGLELDLLNVLGLSLAAIQGFCAPEVERTFARARELCRLLRDPTDLFSALHGLWTYYQTRGDLETALQLARELHQIAITCADDQLLSDALNTLCASTVLSGSIAESWQHLSEARSRHLCRGGNEDHARYGINPRIWHDGYGGLAAWSFGHLEAALASAKHLGEEARAAGPAFSKVLCHSFAAIIFQLCGDTLRVRQHAEQGSTLSAEEGFAQWTAHTQIMLGWAEEQADAGSGLQRIRTGLNLWETIGAQLARPYYLAILAQATPVASERLEHLSAAVQTARRNHERWWLPELHRLHASTLFQGSHNASPEAVALVEQALSMAREQGAAMLELRSASTLAEIRLCASARGAPERRKAADDLERAYAGLVSVASTEDTRKAQALLAKLSTRPAPRRPGSKLRNDSKLKGR